MRQEFLRCELDDLGALRLHGADAGRFLQGQLSNDVQRLTAGHSVLAGFHTPQGRTIALIRLVYLEADDVLAIVPRERVAPLLQRLAKYVLRAKVTLTDVSAHWRFAGLIGEASADAGALPWPGDAQRRIADTTVVCLGGDPARWIAIRPHPQARPAAAAAHGSDLPPHAAAPPDAAEALLPPTVPASREHWRELDVRAGLPQVYAPTSEQFVAQMLNLDAIGAIAFDKGCYTGQEVIARAHYRGRVKRRLQRFRSRGPQALAPGDTGTLPDGRVFTVIEAARLADGRCEFLAVARLPDALAESAGPAEPARPVDAESLPLPYPLPE